MQLDSEFITRTCRRIEQAIVPCMAKVYPAGPETYAEVYGPGLKLNEKVCGYFDYHACGISALAVLAAAGDPHAAKLVEKIIRNTDYYCRNIFGRDFQGAPWCLPLRRLLFHLALAYRTLEPVLNPKDKAWFQELIEEQVPLAIEHNRRFFPGEKNLHLLPVSNHTAIFMQAIYYCGKIFNHPEWVELTRDFAERYYDSGHPDGYFEEMTNEAREGGPSLVYTCLTAGCLYDVLDGKNRLRDKFVRAGNFDRSFIAYDYARIPIADERTNTNTAGISYGLAYHSLTPQGRYYIVDNLKLCDFSRQTPEAHLHYATFEAALRWEIGDKARLILRANSDRTVTTSLPISDPAFLRTKYPYEIRELKGFSPYSAGNKANPVKALVLDWQKELMLEFSPGIP